MSSTAPDKAASWIAGKEIATHGEQASMSAARSWAIGLMVASGCAALGYQIVWTQQIGLWLGHESAGVLAVVAAFFGGIAVGALAFGDRIERSAQPARWYAACELIIGVWSLALAFLMAPIAEQLLAIIGPEPDAARHWLIAFVGVFLLLLPATAAMGATLPAMERVLAALRRDGSSLAALYAANTLGGVLGVMGVAFALIPSLGLQRTALICAALSIVCAALTVQTFRMPVDIVRRAAPATIRTHLALLAATGFLGIGYEVLVVRVLSQVAENTVYTFAILLALYLIGTSLGAAIYARSPGSSATAERIRDRLLRLLAVACLVSILVLSGAARLKAVALDTFGPGMASALMAEIVLAASAFLLPTLVMGALFSHLATHARVAGATFGTALGVNTLAAALAPAALGLLLLPTLGAKPALLLVTAAYLFLCSPRSWLQPTQTVILAAIVCALLYAPQFALIDIPPGGRIVSHRDGALATVSIVEDASGAATLHINNRQQEGSNVTLIADMRQGLLPVLLHPSPRRALFLGLGTGITAQAAADDSQLQVDAVELLPEVIVASQWFRQSAGLGKSDLRLVTSDARRFVRASDRQYDVIVADNFHPARSGAGALYTVEHFSAVRERLASGGLFVQWLPLHQLDLETLRSIVRSFVQIYPDSWGMLATNSLDTPVLGLVAHRNGERLRIGDVRARLVSARLRHAPVEFGIDDEFALLGAFVAGAQSLVAFAANAPLNTDDRPVVIYAAPRAAYAPESRPRDRLLELVGQLSLTPDELLAPAVGTEASRARLAAYWAARARYLEAGRATQPTNDPGRMLAQVRDPLLEVLRISPDFRPAYDPLLRLATALARTDRAAAIALLTELSLVHPGRSDAREALAALDRAR